MTKRKVAFFDSGIGGLTVLLNCQKYLDDATFYYYGDNARAPYGNLPPTTIRRYVFEAFNLFDRLKVSAAVLACNTATAVCMDELRAKYSFPIVGTEPALLPAAKMGGVVLVLATRATVESKRMEKLLEKACRNYPEARFHLVACDELAGGIEKGWQFDRLKKSLPVCQPNAVVLGCTHYAYVREEIGEFYSAPVFDGNEGVAKRLKEVMEKAANGTISKNFVKNRDERPPLTKFLQKEGIEKLSYEVETEEFLKSINTNKCLQKYPKNTQKTAKTANFPQIYFLGSGREINYKKYEQMFVVGKNPSRD